MFPDEILDGDKVRLRQLVDADLPSFIQFLSDPDVNQWLAIPAAGPPASLEEERTWFQRVEKDPYEVVFAMETQEHILLGNVILHLSATGFRSDSAELGIFIGEKGSWSQGYGTDAVRTLLGYAFGPLGLRRVYLHSDVENHRAHQCFRKCGFRQEGVVKEYRNRWSDSSFVDGVMMSILAHEFKPQDVGTS